MAPSQSQGRDDGGACRRVLLPRKPPFFRIPPCGCARTIEINLCLSRGGCCLAQMHTSMFQPPEEPVDAIVCGNCGSGEREDEILLCDECGRGYHMDCLEVPLQAFPEGEWFCKSCSLRPTLGTIWVPLEDVSAEHGVLAMLASSQYLSNFTKNYRKSQV